MNTRNLSAVSAPEDPARAPAPTTVVQLVLAWGVVGIPLAWGVWQVVKKSLDLFH